VKYLFILALLLVSALVLGAGETPIRERPAVCCATIYDCAENEYCAPDSSGTCGGEGGACKIGSDPNCNRNNVCDSNEREGTCEGDCYCGDGICKTIDGESNSNCPSDCVPPPPNPYCGDNRCQSTPAPSGYVEWPDTYRLRDIRECRIDCGYATDNILNNGELFAVTGAASVSEAVFEKTQLRLRVTANAPMTCSGVNFAQRLDNAGNWQSVSTSLITPIPGQNGKKIVDFHVKEPGVYKADVSCQASCGNGVPEGEEIPGDFNTPGARQNGICPQDTGGCGDGRVFGPAYLGGPRVCQAPCAETPLVIEGYTYYTEKCSPSGSGANKQLVGSRVCHNSGAGTPALYCITCDTGYIINADGCWPQPGDGRCVYGESGSDCYCGDGVCDISWDGGDLNCAACPGDCGADPICAGGPSYCGDGGCDPDESPYTCREDCGEPY
jgi:hypothetical protein